MPQRDKADKVRAQGGVRVTDAQPNIHRRRLGLALKGLRTAAGLTLKEAAEQLALSGESALSRIEHGRQRVQPTAVLGYFEVYGLRDQERRNYLMYLAKQAASGKQSNLFEEYRTAIRDPFADYLQLEELASRSETFASIVPGLLQTEAYARAVVQGSRKWQTGREIDNFIRLRMARQAVLTRETPMHLWCVLDESAVRRQVGGPEVMREQLRYLLDVCEAQPSITLQILPFDRGSHAAMDGGFHLLHFPAGPPVVVVEPMTTTLFLEEDSDIGRYETCFNHLRSEALDGEASLGFIHDAIKEQD
ncbi:helix-turn-helix domain-containing protein [Streptomyces avicenniae]|uniref:helix-turn-helix domain-containing protein n=1 Tax=Streptomyces avicenniae TaxID=500153 RepID=UPI001CBA668A|nr:helix-turn-helix transcriptional regulator [Streptomyces avicenniae]